MYQLELGRVKATGLQDRRQIGKHNKEKAAIFGYAAFLIYDFRFMIYVSMINHKSEIINPSIPFLNKSSGEVVGENLPIIVSLACHHGGPDLAQPYAVSPTGTGQDEPSGDIELHIFFVHDKS